MHTINQIHRVLQRTAVCMLKGNNVLRMRGERPAELSRQIIKIIKKKRRRVGLLWQSQITNNCNQGGGATSTASSPCGRCQCTSLLRSELCSAQLETLRLPPYGRRRRYTESCTSLASKQRSNHSRTSGGTASLLWMSKHEVNMPTLDTIFLPGISSHKRV